MKTVDLRNQVSQATGCPVNYKIHPRYFNVKQPMKIYYGTEELKQNEKNPLIIYNLSDLAFYIKNKGIRQSNYTNVSEDNVFLATNEKYIPEYMDGSGYIIYRLKDNKEKNRREPIRVDNCFIQLFVIHHYQTRMVLFTSSGIWMVNFEDWVSAAVKYNFNNTQRNVLPTGDNHTYKRYIDNLVKTKQYKSLHLKLFNSLFNPLSETFGKPYESVKKSFKRVKRGDKESAMKIIRSEVFLKLMFREIIRLMPQLQKALKLKLTPEKVAELLDTFLKNAVESEATTVEEKIKAFTFAIERTYPEEILTGIGADSVYIPHNQVMENKRAMQMLYDDEDITTTTTAQKELSASNEKQDNIDELRVKADADPDEYLIQDDDE